MFSIEQLRARFSAMEPRELLEQLAATLAQSASDGFKPPMMTVYLASGTSFRGYLVDAGGEADRHYLFCHETKNDGDGARDLCYVNGNRIEAITVWDADYIVDEIPSIG